MKKMFLALIVLLLLGGAGAGGYFFFFAQSAEASVGENDEHQAAEDVDVAGDGHGEEGDGSGRFVELDPLVLPIIDNSGITQTLSLVIVLEVKNGRAERAVEANEPRLKDAYIQGMYGALNRHVALDGGVLKVKVIKDRLLKISRQVLGEEAVEDVLLQVVQQRPL